MPVRSTRSRTAPRLRPLIAAALAALPATSFAATKYWDTNDTTAGSSAAATAPGTWDVGTTANWSTSSAGTAASTTFANGDAPVFAAGTNATGSYTVTLTGTSSATPVSVAGITVGEGTVTIGGAAQFLKLTSGTLNVASALTLQPAVSGTLGISLAGTGTVTLSNAANTFTGNVNVAAGTLTLGAAGAVPSANTVTIAAGQLNLSNHNQTFAGIISSNTSSDISLGSATLTLASPASTSYSWYADDITGTGGIVISGAGTQILTTNYSYTGATTLNSGILKVDSLHNAGTSSSIGASASGTGNTADKLVFNGGTLLWIGPTTLVSTSDSSTDRNFTLGTAGGTINASGSTAKAGNLGFVTFSGAMTTLGTTGATNTLTLTGPLGGSLTGVLADGVSPNTNLAAISKTATGTWDLTAANTYSGGTTISAGTLRINNNTSLGDAGSPVTLATATLSTTATTNRSLNYAWSITGNPTLGQAAVGTGVLTLAGTMDLNGAARSFTLANPADTISALISNGGITLAAANTGTLTLSSTTSTYTTGVNITGGTLIATNDRALGAVPTTPTTGNIKINNATFQPSPITINSNRGITLAGTTATIAVPAGTLSYGGTINGTALTKTGTGTLLLTGTESYTGATTLSAGTLQFGNNSPVGTVSTSSIANSDTLIVNNSDSATLAAAISGTGSITKTGTGSLTLPGASSFSGDISINAGSVTFSGNSSFTGNIKVNAGSITATKSNALGTGPKTVSLATITAGVNPTLYLDGTAGNISLPSSVTLLTSNSSGAVVNLAGNNTIAGNVSLTSGGGNSAFVSTAGTLTLAGTLSPITTSRSLILDGDSNGFLTGTAKDGILVYSLSLIKQGAGTWTSSGPNSYTGTTTISNGSLAIGADNTLPTNTPVTISSPGTLDLNSHSQTIASLAGSGSVNLSGPLTLAGSSDSTFSGLISGTSTLTKTGPATQTLSNLSLPSVTISAGTLAFAPSLPAASSITTLTASTGLLDLNNNALALSSSQDTVRSLISSAYNTGNWNGSSGITTSATSEINSIGYLPASAFSSTPFTWQNITVDPATDTLLMYTLTGDINLDGQLDSDDYALLDRGFAKYSTGSIAPTSAHWLDGDLNYDGIVDSSDYLLMDTAYITTNDAAAPSILAQRQAQFGDAYVQSLIASVPEPTSLLTACGFALPLLSRRRRVL